MWSLNSSKAWIRIQSATYIPAILITQVFAAIWLDLRQFHNVLLFGLLTASVPMPMYLLDAFLGVKECSEASVASD